MKIERMFGTVLGAGLLVAATVAIWCWPKPEREAPPEEPVRPIKSVVVVPGDVTSDLYFAAKVRAENRRVLVFKQSGIIQRILVDNGARIKKGDKLAYLDPSDYEDKLQVAKANAERNRLTYERTKKAYASRGVSKEELSRAEAAMRSTDSAVDYAERALADTVLYAPFDGFVAKKLAEEMEVVDQLTGFKEIMIVQDDVNIKIDASIPETMVIGALGIKMKNSKEAGNAYVTFDACPARRYPVKFFAFERTSEESAAQVYVATFILPRPDDLMLLPGMSATLVLPSENYSIAAELAQGVFRVPEAAVGAADDGSHFVWVLEKSETPEVYVARRRPITLGSPIALSLLVTAGLNGGERIATSGVTQLVEGRKVSLFKEPGDK